MTADEDQPATPPASVRNVGALASMRDAPPDDYGYATIDLRLFAPTEGGDRVLDPQEPSTSLRIDPSKLAGLELSVQMSLRLRAAPSGARLEAWERIAGALAAQAIAT